MVYSTYLGGSGDESCQCGIAVDTSGNAYITGWTSSTDFPTANPLQAANGGGFDAFVTKVDPTGSALVYSTYLGGSGDDAGQGIVVDSLGNAYVTGWTESTNFPTANPLQAASGGGGLDAFVAKIASQSLKAFVQPPINADGSSIFKANRGVIPVKFTLTLNDVPTCTLPPVTISFPTTAKRNWKNGNNNQDDMDDNYSWNCGHEGEEGVPSAVLGLRRKQVKNFCCLLLLERDPDVARW